MSTLLLIHTSLNGADSLSSAVAGEYVRAWRAEHPGGRVISRDLAADPVPHLTAEGFAAFGARDGLKPSQRAVVELSDRLIGELRAADTIVIGLPMYNFGIPSTLKAYFDHVARAGSTFRYNSEGPQGLLAGRRVVVCATRGGTYAGTPQDTQTAYVRNFLAFLGMDEVEFVYAEGTAKGEVSLQAALAAARRRIDALWSRAA